MPVFLRNFRWILGFRACTGGANHDPINLDRQPAKNLQKTTLIFMNKITSALLFAAALVLFACQSPQAPAEQAQDTVATPETATATAPAPEAPYDPDPTDTVPGDRYIIHATSAQTADLVRKTLQEKMKADLEKNLLDSSQRKFMFFEYDLNDDGQKEVFVGLVGSYFCGSGGCSPYLLDSQGNVITHFSVSDYPIIVDNNKTAGYKDLFIYSGGKYRVVKYDGKKYPSNPSLQPALKTTPGDGLPRLLDFIHEPYPRFNF
jgi:hypothetical protein